MSYSLYKLTCPNGKVYIGTTQGTPQARWQNGHGYENNKPLRDDIMKYGWDNFNRETLEEGIETIQEAHFREGLYILIHHSNEPEYGYNSHINYSTLKDILPRKTKRVRNVETGDIYISIKEAAKTIDRAENSIYKAIYRNGTCGGYHWEYLDDEENKEFTIELLKEFDN